MAQFTATELTEALRAVDSIIHKCQKAQEKFPEGNAHHTLLRNRLQAMYISRELLAEALAKCPQPAPAADANPQLLLANLALLHTTELGAARIQKNLGLATADVVGWCRDKIQHPDSQITRAGKNWYIVVEGCKLTVNAHSYTIITAHLANPRQ